MNLSRLMILGLLAERGPMHGHQVRRTSELTNAEAWGGITPGALYSELRRLATEGLIRAVRTEQLGRRPARTVYEITAEGRVELTVQREEALNRILDGADAVTVVLLFASGGRLGELRRRLVERRAKVVAELEATRTERKRLQDQGVLGVVEVGAFRRGEYRLEAELIWQAEFDRQLSEAERAATLHVVPDSGSTAGERHR
jgi:DNA-binding PadR family transcriptional regulator